MGPDGNWTVSPVYDLTFSSGPGGEHCTTIMGEGKKPGDGQLLQLAEEFAIPKSRAQQAINKVRAAISDWKSFADEADVSKTSKKIVAKTILPNRGAQRN